MEWTSPSTSKEILTPKEEFNGGIGCIILEDGGGGLEGVRSLKEHAGKKLQITQCSEEGVGMCELTGGLDVLMWFWSTDLIACMANSDELL